MILSNNIVKSVFFTALLLVSLATGISSCSTDKCTGTNCGFGFCKDGICYCRIGYQGPHCDTLSRTNYLGIWNVNEKGTITPANTYAIYITTDTPANAVQIHNLSNFLGTVRGLVNRDTLTIPNQQLQGHVVYGIGFFVPTELYGQYGAIAMKYAVVDTGLTYEVDDFGYYPLIDGSQASNWVR